MTNFIEANETKCVHVQERTMTGIPASLCCNLEVSIVLITVIIPITDEVSLEVYKSIVI